MMDGVIHIESQFGVGSSFILELHLPISIKNNLSVTDDNITVKSLENEINVIENINILVAEDNKMNQTLLVMLLEDSKLNLEFAQDGAIAVEMFKKNNYDLILMDIQMPNMNGYDATELIREEDKEIPIIGLSANAMEDDVKKALESGMNSYVAKPIDIEKLYIELLKYIGKV
ncbi:MAG: response regulator [Campylobacterota bacterium]|nr:response regulator [Campylobacterota bacterium]